MSNDLGGVLPTLKKGMGDIDFAILQQYIKQEPYSRGDVIVSVGDVMDFAFVPIKGRLGASLSNKGGENMEINTLAAGSWVGQMYFLEPGESSTTLIALEDGMLGRLTRDAFIQMSKNYPATADKLLHTLSLELSNRMRKAGKLLFERFAWDQVEGVEGEDGAKLWFTKVYCEMNGLFA